MSSKELSQIQQLMQPLSINDIEFRIGTVKKNSGFSLLAYKTARTDVKRLNEVFGLNWSNEYFYDDKGLLCSKISILSDGQWVSRVDVGTESATEKEKGSYSDAFKRAGFKFGIGTELYNFPFIWLQWSEWSEYNGKVTPKFQISDLKIDEYESKDGEVVKLSLSYKGNIVFKLGTFIKVEPKSKAEIPKTDKQEEVFKPCNENQIEMIRGLLNTKDVDVDKFMVAYKILDVSELSFTNAGKAIMQLQKKTNRS